jgi:hypothetical protein
VYARHRPDLVANATIPDRLATVGVERVAAVAMVRAAISDDIVRQVADMTDAGWPGDEAIASAASWWSAECCEAITDGVRRAREVAA